ncbi:DNA-binding transcriptional regulator, AcrR family [Raineyella antarctica]|uniref:DNA-binding transcriptional regulator, AcrR family n=1 Tax=Raineyella antarctica TaxID=1577474 RepID=A0A1G6GFA6_9ACTN|nr:TetR/AcrR family transcriptional regulator [Raineyella antarctica]SDB80650.1 DNA-binding transcriptional regulator, AcrR family [Raineyella antarctica]
MAQPVDHEERAGHAPANGARRGRPGYDQETLLAVCVDVFNRHGYDATSMGMLAEELGISKAAIYHHVKSKEELLSLSLDRALSRLDRVVADARATEGPARTRLELLVRGSVRALVEERPHVTLLLRLRGNNPLEQHALERRRALTRELEGRFENAQQEGGVRADVSARHLARLVFGMINSMIDWYRPERDDADAVADAVVGILFEGVLASGDAGDAGDVGGAGGAGGAGARGE